MYFILLDAILSGIVFLISFPDCSLQMYRNTIDFGILKKKKNPLSGTSLAVQWLRLHASTAEGAGSIPGLGTKTPHVCRGREKQQQHCLRGAVDGPQRTSHPTLNFLCKYIWC